MNKPITILLYIGIFVAAFTYIMQTRPGHTPPEQATIPPVISDTVDEVRNSRAAADIVNTESNSPRMGKDIIGSVPNKEPNAAQTDISDPAYGLENGGDNTITGDQNFPGTPETASTDDRYRDANRLAVENNGSPEPAPAPENQAGSGTRSNLQQISEGTQGIRNPEGAVNSQGVSVPFLDKTYKDGRQVKPFAMQEYFGNPPMADTDENTQKTFEIGRDKLKENMKQLQSQ